MKKYKYTRVLTFEGKKYYIRGDTLEEVIEKKALKLRDLEEGRVVLNRTTLVKGVGRDNARYIQKQCG